MSDVRDPAAVVNRPHDVTALKRQNASLHKMLIAMAIDKYGFKPAAPRNSAPAAIAGACERRGVPVDQETVLAHLRNAAELLPDDGDE